MKPAVLGFDTSNYRTSVAAVDESGEILFSFREILRVPSGERGLRQSDAVFAHLKQIPGAEEIIRNHLKGCKVVAVAASARPRDASDSYMPVFQVGVALGSVTAAAFDVPFYRTSHQRGHIEAAAYGTVLGDEGHYLALHLSGGTTDLLRVDEERIRFLGGSADLHAGQLVDRAGVAMGLPFPAGEAMEELAREGNARGLLGCSMAENDLICHLSGAESQVQRWLREGQMNRRDIAREIYDFLARTTARLADAGKRETGEDRILVTGGVASSALYRRLLEDRLSGMRYAPQPIFGRPDMSGDNAFGVAVTGWKIWRKEFGA